MRNVSGVTGAAPVWTEVMAWLHGAVPSAPPAAPAGMVAAPVAFPGAVEPERLEWFLAGTEPPTAAPAIAGGHPRIIAPVSGTIIALDPDIPDGRERLVFEATDAREALRWVLDGNDLGSARDLHVWRPLRGRHALELVDGHGRVVDRVSFDVRGVPRAAHAEPAR
jgi:penicillin-binding protein 1C